jgi:hypothetical protein
MEWVGVSIIQCSQLQGVELKMWASIEKLCTLARQINPLNTELNHICHLVALLAAHRILHVSRIKVKAKRCNTHGP